MARAPHGSEDAVTFDPHFRNLPPEQRIAARMRLRESAEIAFGRMEVSGPLASTLVEPDEAFRDQCALARKLSHHQVKE